MLWPTELQPPHGMYLKNAAALVNEIFPGLRQFLCSEKFPLDHRTESVIDRQMQFLNFKGLRLRDANADIALAAHLPASLTRQSQDIHANRPGYQVGIEDVGRIARGRNGPEQVVRHPETQGQLSKSELRIAIVTEGTVDG